MGRFVKVVFFVVVSAALVSLIGAPARAADVVADSNRSIELTAQALVAEKGEARTFAYGPIVDDQNNRSVFRVPAMIADITGLKFVPLAIIQQHGGDVALYAAISGLSDKLPRKSEAQALLARRQLIYFERPYYENYFRNFPKDDPVAFSNAVAREVWEGFKAEYGDLSSTDPKVLADRFPEAADVARIIHVDLVPIAGIRAVGGISGLNELLILLPDDLPGKDDAIKALSKAKKP